VILLGILIGIVVGVLGCALATRRVPAESEPRAPTVLTHWINRETGKMMVGTPEAKASWQAAEAEYAKAMNPISHVKPPR